MSEESWFDMKMRTSPDFRRYVLAEVAREARLEGARAALQWAADAVGGADADWLNGIAAEPDDELLRGLEAGADTADARAAAREEPET